MTKLVYAYIDSRNNACSRTLAQVRGEAPFGRFEKGGRSSEGRLAVVIGQVVVSMKGELTSCRSYTKATPLYADK